MNDKEQRWKQYRNNPHLQRNILTKEFRCKTCNLSLGDNAGGAGSHCKGTHGIRIDGTPIKKEIPIQREDNPQTETQSKNESSMQKLKPHDYLRTLFVSKPVEPSRSRPPTESEKFQYKKRLFDLIKENERQGVPEELLKPLREELGLKNYWDQLAKGKEEEEKRKKEKEKRKQELKSLTIY